MVNVCWFLMIGLSFLAEEEASAELPVEADYYEIVEIPAPDGAVFEVSGLLPYGDGSVLFCTRRGEIWLAKNFYEETPEYVLFLDGLQEPMGLLSVDGWIYTVQRAELSRMKDGDGDGRCDILETVCDDWLISGNYHEYAFGPRRDPEGNLWVTLNKPFGAEPFGKVEWRGWAIRVNKDGVMEPVCAGLRSPAGLEASPEGEMFYTDNQGEWCGASKLSHLEVGDFHGHPHGIESAKLPESKVKYPGEVPDRIMMVEAKKKFPSLKMPAIWFPYDKMGKSPSGLVWDQTGGKFGPFTGQVFVGDQHHASVMRCFLEKVNGHWQGACFPFRSGFKSGLIRVAWGEDDSLIAGLSNRGWGSKGKAAHGLERLVWKGENPFEILRMSATSLGFRLRFTQPIDPSGGGDKESYRMESYTYRLHSDYGSSEMEKKDLVIDEVVVAEGNLEVELIVTGLRPGFVHELHLPGVKNRSGMPLLHAEAYYTLIEIPSDGS